MRATCEIIADVKDGKEVPYSAKLAFSGARKEIAYQNGWK